MIIQYVFGYFFTFFLPYGFYHPKKTNKGKEEHKKPATCPKSGTFKQVAKNNGA